MFTLLAMSFFAMAKIVSDHGDLEKEQIQIQPVNRTPESNTVSLRISAPEKGEVKVRNPVWVQFRLDGYPLGTDSQFDRADEIASSKQGQTVHVFVDDYPYIAVAGQPVDPFNEDGWYYDTGYKFEIPYSLKTGIHTIRMFPARSYGESLKGENTFQATYFYVGTRDMSHDVNLNKPYITYNEPSGQIPLTEGQPVLLDFYVTNCALTSDGYKILVTIDGKTKRTLTSWQPYYIYGLTSGKHTVRMQLLDANNKQVPGAFNDVQKTIKVS